MKTVTFMIEWPSPVDICRRPDLTDDQIIREAFPRLFGVLADIPHAIRCNGVFPQARLHVDLADDDYIRFKQAGGDDLIRREDF